MITIVNVRIPILIQSVVDNILGNQYKELWFMVLQILVLTGIAGVFTFIQRYTNGYFSQRVIYAIRNDVFSALQNQSFSFYDKTETGQLISRTTTDVERIRHFLGWQLTSLVSSLSLLGGVVATAIFINWELTILAFIVMPFVFIVIYRYGKKIRPIISLTREQYGRLTSVLLENLIGIRVVRAFVREKFERKKFQSPNMQFFKTTLNAVKLRAFYFPLTTFLTGLGTIAIFWYGGWLVIQGKMTIGNLLAFNLYLGILLRPMVILGFIWGGYQRMAAAGERVFGIIYSVPEIKNKPNAIKLPAIKGEVMFHKVSFSYKKDVPIIKEVTLKANPGETVALLGHTGSGKTTIIRLLPRFYDVTSGKITVDGYNIRNVDLKSLRQQIGIVSQESFLFAATIKDNIAYGKPNASMKQIIQAAKVARAHEFITALPEGYNTVVGERGATLSGGQKQRISIARALLKDPKILILDDSTSSIDVDTEYEIQQALKVLLKERTTFVITQRVSTIRGSDKILVLEDGKIIEDGTHDTLMPKKGAYYNIYQTLFEAQQSVFKNENTANSDYKKQHKKRC